MPNNIVKKNFEKQKIEQFEKMAKDFLRAIELYGSIRKACTIIGYSTTTVKNYLDEYPKFKRAYLEAQDRHIGMLETEAIHRVKGGSDTMLKFMLIAHDPEKYGRGNPQTVITTNTNIKADTIVKNAQVVAKEFKNQILRREINPIGIEMTEKKEDE